ncbi:hypothetical protein UPYG_G00271930 [Umbra pygmaea]|uniref:C-type lectin domain-containing protein n=1 Tax=Umbra pygmaea TaxID=75934 RepID=A0ABD0WCL7_UMBPY
MSEAIYAKPDMNNKVKFNRGEMEERMVDIYVSADKQRDGDTRTTTHETEDTAVDNGPGDKSSAAKSSVRRTRVSAVCLGLLCVLLLAGIIVLYVHYSRTSYTLTKERDQLQTSNKTLTKEKDQLQTSYNTLTKEKDQLQTSYNTLTKEKDQLQTSYNTLTKERDQLQTSNNILTQEKDQLWRYFGYSFYFVSTEKRTWEESRQDCQSRGADLVIINSEEEQKFLSNFKMEAWIGLTDKDQEGTWRWVDGTVLTTWYWSNSEPNGGRRENCGETYNKYSKPGYGDFLKTWIDNRCEDNLQWICEQKV